MVSLKISDSITKKDNADNKILMTPRGEFHHIPNLLKTPQSDVESLHLLFARVKREPLNFSRARKVNTALSPPPHFKKI